jgi:hypothetical protein
MKKTYAIDLLMHRAVSTGVNATTGECYLNSFIRWLSEIAFLTTFLYLVIVKSQNYHYLTIPLIAKYFLMLLV